MKLLREVDRALLSLLYSGLGEKLMVLIAICRSLYPDSINRIARCANARTN